MDLSDWANGIVPGGAEPLLPDPSGVPATRIPVRDSFETAPGYREIGMFYSCVPDAAYPWDPAIVRRMWAVAPDVVPLWVQWVFLSPRPRSEIVVFGRHAVGRRIQTPRTQLEPMRVLMPTMPCQGLTFEKPNAIWFIHQGPMGQHPKYKDLPGDYLPFDWALAAKVENMSRDFRMTEKEFRESAAQEMIDRVVAARARRKAEHAADMDARDREIEPFLRRAWGKVADSEIALWNRSAGKVRRQPKVLVDLGSTPGRM